MKRLLAIALCVVALSAEAQTKYNYVVVPEGTDPNAMLTPATNGLAPVTYVNAQIGSVSNMVTDSSGFFAYLIGTNANLVNGTYYQQFYSGVVYNVGNVYTNGVFTPNSTGLWMVAVTAFGADLADHTFLETEVTHAVSAATTNVYIRWDGSGGASGNFSTTWSIPVYVNATSETFRLFVRHGDGGNDVDVWGGLFSFGPYTTRYFSWWGAWKVHQ